MLQLFLIRHAKSSWADAALNDHQRPLNNRGQNDLPRMSERLKIKGWYPERIFCSTARRAVETYKGLEHIFMERPECKVSFHDDLYLCTHTRLNKFISEITDQYTSVALIGHNPGMTDFVNHYTNIRLDNLPTLGIIGLECEAGHWADTQNKEWKFKEFIYPKMV